MSTNRVFKLIEGEFDAHDAAEVLLSVISDKINFHEVQLLSCQERNSGDAAYSKKRFEELRHTREEVTELLREAREKNLKLQINSDIEIKITE